MKRRWWWLGALMLGALVLVISTMPAGTRRDASAPTKVSKSAKSGATSRTRSATLPGEPTEQAVDRKDRRARAEALKEKIAEALERKSQRTSKDSPRGHSDNDAQDEADEHPVGELRDRIGGRSDLMEALNEGFMPLASECVDQALERDPSIEGMVAVGLVVIGDPELGAVVESVEFPDRNELRDEGLLECIRETALSTTMPPPPKGGRDELMITFKTGE